jgi:type I restriction-modification system DNA methylase subunit
MDIEFQKIVNELFDFTYSNSSIRVPEKVGIEVGKILHTGLFREEHEKFQFSFNYSEDELSLIKNFNQDFVSKTSSDIKKSFLRMNDKLDLYSEKIQFTDAELVYLTSFLNKIKISDKNKDIFGDALEIFRSYWAKKEGGQFFTNQQVTSLALKLIQFNPLNGDDLVDICAGTGGFLLAGFHKIRELIYQKKGKEKNIIDLAKKSLLGIEIDKYICKVGNSTLSSRLGTKSWEHIFNFNSLEKELIKKNKKINFNKHLCVASNPPFGAKIKIRNLRILENFSLAKMKGKNFNSVLPLKKPVPRSPDILFVEQNIKLLKPGKGRLAIVMPYQLLSGSEATYIRHWILTECSIIAIIDLPNETFQPHTGTKTSLVVLKKREKRLENLKNNTDRPIFMATPRWIGHDRRGNLIFDKKSSNKILSDFPIVEEEFNNFIFNRPIKNYLTCRKINSNEIYKDEFLRFNAMFYKQKNEANLIENTTKNKNKWKKIKLESVIEKIFYPGRFKRNYVDYYNGAVPFLGGSNITELITKTNKWIRPDDKNIKQLQVKTGWILITRSGSTGIISTVPKMWDNFAISEHVIRIIPDEKKMPKEYLVAFLKSKLGQLELSKGIFGSVIEEISPKSISDINILVPKNKKIFYKIVSDIKKAENHRNLSMEFNSKAINQINNFFSN